MLQFDPEKDRINLGKHGISLAAASEMEIRVTVKDDRFREPRFRAYGLIEGKYYCLALTYRGVEVRAISLRRARMEEVERYVREFD